MNRGSFADTCDGLHAVYGISLERELNTELANSLSTLTRIGAVPPIAVLVSVIGATNYLMLQDDSFVPHWSRTNRRIDRDVLLLPELILDAYPDNFRDQLPRLMRPIVDASWQEIGRALGVSHRQARRRFAHRIGADREPG